MKKYYTWQEFREDLEYLTALAKKNKEIKYLYGVPRGGIALATALQERTGFKVLNTHELGEYDSHNILVCDDIVDSGKTRERFSKYDFICVHARAGYEKMGLVTHTAHIIQQGDWIVYPWESEERPGEDIIIRFLQLIGEDPKRDGLIDTPARVLRMWEEFFQGYDPSRKPKMTKVPNGQDGVFYDEMLKDGGYFFSFCEHHIIPFFGQYWFGYIPDKWILGASKISRIIDYYAGKLQIAERLVDDVVHDIETEIQPKGLILVMKARHLCKEMRGVRKWNSPYEAIAVRGLFRTNTNNCKMEFLSRIK